MNRALHDMMAFRRYDANGQCLDALWWPFSPRSPRTLGGSGAIEPVWVRRLQEGTLGWLEVKLVNGQTIRIKRKRAKAPRFVMEPPNANGDYHCVIDTLHPRPEAGDAV
jgi:hypothetical protein